MEKTSSENHVSGDDSSDRHGESLPVVQHTALHVKLPLWARVIARLPINPQIPYALEKYLPALTGLVCYAYLPAVVILSYMVAVLYIVTYFEFPVAHVLLAIIFGVPSLVSLKIQTSRFLRWSEGQKGFRWQLDKSIDEYVKLVKKKRR